MDATSGLRSPKIRDYETCKVHPRKLMMNMEKQPFQDVWSYEKHGDFPAIVMLVFMTWGFITLPYNWGLKRAHLVEIPHPGCWLVTTRLTLHIYIVFVGDPNYSPEN